MILRKRCFKWGFNFMLIHSLHLLATSIVTGHGVRLPEDQWVAFVRFLVVILSRGLLSDMKLKSLTEDEYWTMSHADFEVAWLQNIFNGS